MSTDIEIRAVVAGDMPALNEVWSQPRVIWGTLQLPHRSIEMHIKRHEATPQDQDHVHLCAVIDGKAIGSAGMRCVSAQRRRAHAANIGMCVHDTYAGRGAGTALLAALLDMADNWLAYTRVDLTVWADNPRAIGLYERAGFEREGLLRRYAFRDGEYVDAITMARLRA